ncbi:MAG: Na/Pi cotransporter family protein [Armatimonadetes bacterium]|nr:Na/Pi cotransporter family protein [Candidatus Hippobium faecium]
MDILSITTSVLTLFAGIGVFLIACKMMSTGMETLSGDRLKALFKKVSGNPFIGIGIGTFATMLVQSSGATTVMVLGFVNAGIMSLYQAVTIVYGACIGTTITGQIVALGMLGDETISTSVIFSALAGVGAFMALFAGRNRTKNIGNMLAGFGMLFVGLMLMSSSMKAFADNGQVKHILETIRNPLLLTFIGMALTALVNSSSVMTSVAIAMVYAGLISLDQGIYIALGANVGACITGILASITGNENSKRVCFVNVVYKVIGVGLFLLLGYLLTLFTDYSFGSVLEKMFPGKPQVQLAMFHTIFNCIIAILLLPLTGMFIKWSLKFIPTQKKDEKENAHAPKLYFINDNMLRTPPVAVSQLKKEIVNMAKISLENFCLSCDIVCSLDYKELETFRYNELELNYLNKKLVNFVVRLSNNNLNEKDRVYLSTTIKTISDLERVGDYAENIVEYADSLRNNSDKFSSLAVEEIIDVRHNVEKLFARTIEAYEDMDAANIPEINMIEDEIDRKTKEMEKNHIKRLGEGVCTPNVGAQYLSLATNIERIGDHYVNVSKAVLNMNL